MGALLRERVTTQSDEGDASIFAQTNVAIWVLTGASGAFLAVRIWCRHRFSKLFWDDALLVLSWVRTHRTARAPPSRHLF